MPSTKPMFTLESKYESGAPDVYRRLDAVLIDDPHALDVLLEAAGLKEATAPCNAEAKEKVAG